MSVEAITAGELSETRQDKWSQACLGTLALLVQRLCEPTPDLKRERFLTLPIMVEFYYDFMTACQKFTSDLILVNNWTW
jgi:hypothetical protein